MHHCFRDQPAETKKAKVKVDKVDSTVTQRDLDFFVDGRTGVPPLPSALIDVFRSCGTLVRPPRGCHATYFFPVPWQVWAEDEKRLKRLTHNYIRIRSFCLRRHFSESFDELARPSEFWKEAIKGNYNQTKGLPEQASQIIVTKNDTLPPPSSLATVDGSRRIQRKMNRAYARTEFGCNGELEPWSPEMVVIWKNNALTYENVTTQIWQEVQWELYEMNWRSELLAIDLRLARNSNGAIDHVAKRKSIVGSIWGRNNTGIILFPTDDTDHKNIFSTNAVLEIKWEVYNNFRTMLSAWPNFPQNISDKNIDNMGSLQLHSLSKDLFRFYVQSFFAEFHRLPILPRLPP